jgi:hypothetical protein
MVTTVNMASNYTNEFDTTSSIARIKTLLNRDLAAILKAERLQSHGVKAQMQDRLIKSMSKTLISAPFPLYLAEDITDIQMVGLLELAQARDQSAFNTLRSYINRPGDIPSSSTSIKGYNGQSSPANQPPMASPYGGVKRPSSSMAMPSYHGKWLART